MATSDYTHGEMNIDSQASTYASFMRAGMWGAIIILLMLAYATFTLSIGMHWLVALSICAGSGIALGLFMGLGGAWVATIIGLAGLALFIQVLVEIGRMLV